MLKHTGADYFMESTRNIQDVYFYDVVVKSKAG